MLLFIILLFLTSFVGFSLNVSVLLRFEKRSRPLSGFYKLCLFKTFPNIIISSLIAFWAVPLSFLQLEISDIPTVQNLMFSQLVGGFSYTLGPLLQICMALNRLVLIYFPFSYKKLDRLKITNLSIIASNCYLIYNPQSLVLLPQRKQCAHSQNLFIFLLILTLSLTANIVNVIIAIRLLTNKDYGLSNAQIIRRRRKCVSMFVQTAIQDILQLVDITNYNFISKIIDEPWWEFTFCSLSFSAVYALDGAVMLYFHKCSNEARNQEQNVRVSESSGTVRKVQFRNFVM
ncbi:unnamed protein product [Caenorhabditis sp. 36 PRJEB53466]|nr:unnamed protein product [Caenorhabditis sp. 36 PRJEB53466]